MDESEELLFDDTQSDYDEVACDTIDGDILFRTDDDDSDLFLDDEDNDDNESILLPDDSGDESDIFYPFEDVPGGAFPPQQSINFGEEMKIVEPGGAAHTKDR